MLRKTTEPLISEAIDFATVGWQRLYVKFLLLTTRKPVLDSNNRKCPEGPSAFSELMLPAVLPDGNGGFVPCPELLTEDELIIFLRIPEISKSQDYRNVIENLKRMHDLPRIHLCGKPLYPLEGIRAWIKKKTIIGK